jgi:chemotaxis protein MotA
MVFGGYTMAGGQFGIILYALPFELTMIGGGALGAFLIANSGAGAKQTARDILQGLRGPTGSRATTAICCACCSN